MPKSASEYIPDVLGACLDIPAYFGGTHTFPRNRVIPRLTAISSRGGALLRLHMEACEANFAILKEAGIPRLVLHLRDPRQATLSWVHMLRRIDDKRFDLDRLSYTPVVRIEFRDFDLPDQLDWAVTNFYPRLIQWLTDWIDALPELERDMAVLVTTFADFVDDPGKYFEALASFHSIELDNIDSVLQAHPPTSTQNFRAGKTDEWREVFTRDQQRRMWERIPEPVSHGFGAWT